MTLFSMESSHVTGVQSEAVVPHLRDLLIGFFGFFDNFLAAEAIRSRYTWAIFSQNLR
jgi:hypothetical protein